MVDHRVTPCLVETNVQHVHCLCKVWERMQTCVIPTTQFVAVMWISISINDRNQYFLFIFPIWCHSVTNYITLNQEFCNSRILKTICPRVVLLVQSITVTPQWARWRLKSPTFRVFAQSFVQAQIKEKNQSSASLAFVRGIERWLADSP